tara:strand:- start:1994 stop:2644 length:651 start_codon:yes stop_codon:yes gene_type:complete
MADFFVFNWGNGHETKVELPKEKGFDCGYSNPSSEMQNFSGYIVGEAGSSTDLHEVEQYVDVAIPVIQQFYGIASDIKDTWDEKEIRCAKCRGLCTLFGICVCRCKDKGAYCYKSENRLEEAYWNWHPVPAQILPDIQVLLDIKTQATAQIYTDQQQALQQALINQLIAETNEIISVVEYQNEQRELALTRKKTADLFAPIVIILTLIALGLYLYN